MLDRDKVVALSFAEAKNTMASGRSVADLAGEVMAGALERAGIEKSEIDGFATCLSLTEAGNPYWSAILADELGLELDWCDCVDLGGASFVGAVARAALALRAGQCRIVLVLAADTPSTRNRQNFGSYRTEWQDPIGLLGPPGLFGLLTSRYRAQYDLDPLALARLAVTQRSHALLNDLALEQLRKPLAVEDYLGSRMVSDPVRLLDCVMVCDGANAVIMTTRETAEALGRRNCPWIAGYGERINHNIADPVPDITETGHRVAGARAFANAGMSPSDIRMFHPYDDFLIAVLLQMEQLGFCKAGEGSRFILTNDLSHQGNLPTNTGGGQISAGQAGLAGGGHNFVEALRQLMSEGGVRQVRDAHNALITGIGTIPYARNWSCSNVMILRTQS